MNGYEKIIRTKLKKGVEKMFSYLENSGIHIEFMEIEVRFKDGTRDIYQRYDKNGEMAPASGVLELENLVEGIIKRSTQERRSLNEN